MPLPKSHKKDTGEHHQPTHRNTPIGSTYGQERGNHPNRKVMYGPNNLPPDMYDEDGPTQEDEERMGGPWTSAMWRKSAPGRPIDPMSGPHSYDRHPR